MKNKLKKSNIIMGIIILLLATIVLTKYNQNSDLSSKNSQMEETFVGESKEDLSEESATDRAGDKVITTNFLNMETLDFKENRDKIDSLIEENNAFIENMSTGFSGNDYYGNYGYRYGNFSIRIPEENIDKFKTELKDMGNITVENINKQDVSEFYRDTESRLKLVVAKEKRLVQLLGEAKKVEDIIAIESEITDTIYEKERLEKSLQSIDDRIEYQLLDLQLTEVRNYSNIDDGSSSLFTRIKNAFRDSWIAFKSTLESLFIGIVFLLPYTIIVLPVLFIIYRVRKRRRDK